VTPGAQSEDAEHDSFSDIRMRRPEEVVEWIADLGKLHNWLVEPAVNVEMCFTHILAHVWL
jgi:hypothetical protein